MKNKWRFEITLGLLILLTVVAVTAEKKILQASILITPNDGYTTRAFSDKDNGGNSEAEIIPSNNFEWRCAVKEKFAYPYCSFEIVLDKSRTQGIDLSHFTKIRLWLNYEGDNKTIRLYLRNHDPHYSNPNIGSSTKYNQVEFPVDRLKNQYVEFSLNDFFVANWWLIQYKIPPELSHPQFDNIIIVEIQTGTVERYGNHHFQLERIELLGQKISTETWYLAIIITWLGIFAIFLGYRIASLNSELRSQKRREEELIEINALLDLRSQQLEEKTKHDSLTGAFNRLGIEEAIRLGLWEWRSENKPLSLIMIDLDNFKQINDTHGHSAGDLILSSLSKLVIQHIRNNDLFARWGGEEFVLVCRDTQIDQAASIAEKIRELIERCTFENNLQVTASFGVSTLHGDETVEQLFNNADKALYQAKKEGRNKVITFF